LSRTIYINQKKRRKTNVTEAKPEDVSTETEKELNNLGRRGRLFRLNHRMGKPKKNRDSMPKSIGSDY